MVASLHYLISSSIGIPRKYERQFRGSPWLILSAEIIIGPPALLEAAEMIAS